MHLIQIPGGDNSAGVSPLDALWPQVAPLLQQAIELRGGGSTLQDEYLELRNLRKQLWVIVLEDGAEKRIAAAGITSLMQLRGGLKIANIEALGGDNMKAWFSLKDQFESWAREEGCNEVRLYARKGWAKHLPDYKLASYVMSKTLT